MPPKTTSLRSCFAALILGLSACAPGQQVGATSAQADGAQLVVENPAGPPAADRLVFSRIGSPDTPKEIGMHDQSSLRLHNTGSAPRQVTALDLTGPWTVTGVTLPVTIPAGGTLDVPLSFNAAPDLGGAAQVFTGTLTIHSDDLATPSRVVQLAGVWQGYSERTPGGVPDEPSLEQILSAFGYGVRLYTDADKASPTVGSPIPINQHGLVKAQGEEVLSARWQRADAAQPVRVEELAAYEIQGTATKLSWSAADGSNLQAILTHEPGDSQSILPRPQGGSGTASGSFDPPAAFMLQASSAIGTEWTDPTKNPQDDDRDNGCAGPCGSHMRFWPLRDEQGALVPDTYLLIVDYVTSSGPNDDYQDDVFLVHNVKPAK